MSDDHHAARDGVSTLTHAELLEFEQMLHEEFEATYREAQEALAATGTVSADLAERLTQTQAMHVEIVQALELDRLQEEAR